MYGQSFILQSLGLFSNSSIISFFDSYTAISVSIFDFCSVFDSDHQKERKRDWNLFDSRISKNGCIWAIRFIYFGNEHFLDRCRSAVVCPDGQFGLSFISRCCLSS